MDHFNPIWYAFRSKTLQSSLINPKSIYLDDKLSRYTEMLMKPCDFYASQFSNFVFASLIWVFSKRKSRNSTQIQQIHWNFSSWNFLKRLSWKSASLVSFTKLQNKYRVENKKSAQPSSSSSSIYSRHWTTFHNIQEMSVFTNSKWTRKLLSISWVGCECLSWMCFVDAFTRLIDDNIEPGCNALIPI